MGAAVAGVEAAEVGEALSDGILEVLGAVSGEVKVSGPGFLVAVLDPCITLLK